jgi:hypothetical protein
MAIDMKAYNYSMGVATLRTIANALKIKNPTYTMDTLTKFLHVNQADKSQITEDDYHQSVENLGAYKREFTLLGRTSANWDKLWTDKVETIPKGMLPTWTAIHNITGNPVNFKTTILEKISNAGEAAGKAAVTGKQAITKTASNVGGVFDFLGNTKYFLLAGALGIIAYKLFGQSDKIKAAYNTVKGDAGALYEKAKSEGVKGISFLKSQRK